MQVHITGRQVEITPALRKFAEEKLRKVEKLLGGPIEAHVVLAVEKRRHLAEIQVKSRTALLAGMRETEDLYASIGDVADKLERQALKHKEKLVHKKKRDGRKIAAARPVAPAEPEAAPRAKSARKSLRSPRILRSERYRLKPLSAEDAAMELDSGGGDLLVYRDDRTYRVNVVYRRRDGDFGLVDPEF
ncbi:MAG TPA: ribosome-associated translation inhibitor RaiA [Candidatus Polarisedimenticolaceae bacterium]|nr:ribosome-associated translation inhibitor RaiA [Candidatus Polarisedimenticolaceae bacterium]